MAVLLLLSVSATFAASLPPEAERAVAVAREHVEHHAADLGLTPSDLVGRRVTSAYRSRRSGVTHVHFRQMFEGIEVANGVMNVNVGRDGEILGVGSRFVRELAAKARLRAPGLGAVGALVAAGAQLGLEPSVPPAPRQVLGGPGREVLLDAPGISLDPVPAKLAFYAVDADTVRLAWDLVIRTPDHQRWLNLWVDAGTGTVLGHSDWMADDSYEVFALPKESPSDGPRTIQVDPADSTASPFGWHDTDGVAGAEFTDTRGNNVQAQTDLDANNGFGGSDVRADGGATLDFQPSLDLGQGPDTYRAAAVTNLFYWNNVLHDLLHAYGFDEASGNFQENNYGNGGSGGDPVQADAQDGSGFNNANFGTPPDGADPRMQMYVWLPASHEVVVDPPSPAAGTYVAAEAAFGPTFGTTGVSGSILLADDGSAVTTDGCESFPAGFFAGQIALIDRGTCTFVTKVRNAETAGAAAVIVANNAGDSAFAMGDDGTGGTITIPSLMIGITDGQTIRSGLPATGTAREGANPPPARDSDLDPGVIAHEYCHGLSIRLTGGPANSSCLGGDQQAGEGWSDLCTLFFTADPADTATTARGIGTYLVYEPPDGGGIRPYPYSTDLAVNPLTYADIVTAGQPGGLTIPHGVGTVWATAVWEVYWNLTQKYGFDPDLYHGTGGNNLAIQLVVEGLKLQPCAPSFVEARDAILLADQVLTGGANQCEIWEGFAKRGLGAYASDGGTAFTLAVTEDFSLPVACG
ncbi:MAG: M36 family metallopeptidase, partial [Acidobacteriota bacterium]